MSRIRLGIVGCGAVVTRGYLPSCRSLSNVDVVWVADSAAEAAQHAAAEFGVPRHTQDYREMVRGVDAVVIATPPALHASMASYFLEGGVHILCEKPLTRTVAEAAPLIQLAEKHGVHFAVSTNRRFSPGARLLKTILDMGMVGQVTGFELEEGHEFRWPVRSGYRFKKDLTGGGVLAEFGPHVLDSLLWWLGGDIRVISYRDDNLGGVESSADLMLALCREGREIEGSVTISNVRTLANTVTIHGERGSVEAALFGGNKVVYRSSSDRYMGFEVHCDDNRCSHDWQAQIKSQISAFAESIVDGRIRYTPASDALQVIDVVEDCYRRREVSLPSWEAKWLKIPA